MLGPVGKGDDGCFDVEGSRERLAGTELPKSPLAFGIEDEFALLGSFADGPQALARFAGSAAANTDDHPVVAYRAPRITYAPESLPRDRLIALLHELSIEPPEPIEAKADATWKRRMAAYWAARKDMNNICK